MLLCQIVQPVRKASIFKGNCRSVLPVLYSEIIPLHFCYSLNPGLWLVKTGHVACRLSGDNLHATMITCTLLSVLRFDFCLQNISSCYVAYIGPNWKFYTWNRIYVFSQNHFWSQIFVTMIIGNATAETKLRGVSHYIVCAFWSCAVLFTKHKLAFQLLILDQTECLI